MVKLSNITCLCIAFIGLISLMACEGKKNRAEDAKGEAAGHAPVSIEYAQNFSVEERGHHMRLLTIQHAENRRSTAYRYALIDDEASADSVPEGYEPLRVPLQRVVCMTSLQLASFIALDVTESVCGITSTRHLFSPRMQEQLQSGRTVQIGIEGNFDHETIIAIDPQLILISPSKRGGYDVLTESGLPLMPHLGYQEPTPLGQAEWIKLAGLLTGHEAEANAHFEHVAKDYLSLAERVRNLPQGNPKPTVMSGDMKGGHWYATGGRSYLARIFQDAGARYFMADNEDTGGVNLDFETVYAQGADAEFWRISNSFDGHFSYQALASQDSRFADFRAFRERKVIYCNMSRTPFYESFPVRPDLLLADFVAIFHPALLPDHEPTYYRLMTGDEE